VSSPKRGKYKKINKIKLQKSFTQSGKLYKESKKAPAEKLELFVYPINALE
jgi:hypothetical protein